MAETLESNLMGDALNQEEEKLADKIKKSIDSGETAFEISVRNGATRIAFKGWVPALEYTLISTLARFLGSYFKTPEDVSRFLGVIKDNVEFY